MTLELERSGWPNLLNVVNHMCFGKNVTVKVLKKGSTKTLAKNQPFLSLETYLENTNPIIAINLGEEHHLSLSYFIKNPIKIVLKEARRQIEEVSISNKEGREVLIIANPSILDTRNSY